MKDTNVTTERLERLLALQDEARAEREDYIARRSAILFKAHEAGSLDLSETQDAEFRVLTANIHDIDVRLAANDETIRVLADLEALSVPEDDELSAEDKTMRDIAAAAEIYLSWRDSTKGRRAQTETPKPRRSLTIAEARAVEQLDQS